MKCELIKNPRTLVNEAYIDGLKVGVFEQVDKDGPFVFMSKCSHEKLTGDHYILIGKQLNIINGGIVGLQHD